MIGYNEFGHPEFDTQRSQLGELVYCLKYKSDRNTISAIVGVVASFLRSRSISADVIVPMPPSKLQRPYQPVVEIAAALAKELEIALDTASLRKTTTTPQMKDVGDYSERVAALQSAFAVGGNLAEKKVLLLDDLIQLVAAM